MREKIVTLLAVGSHGQVQPYVALGKGLQASGISVRLATSANYESFVKEHGLAFYPISNVDARAIAQSEEGKAIMASKNPFKLLPGLLNLMRPHFAELLDGMLAALDGASVGILNPLTQFGGYDACEKLGISPVFGYVQAVIPMKELCSPFAPPLPAIPGQEIYNCFTHHAMIQVAWQLFRPLVNDARCNRLSLNKSPLRGNWHIIKQKKIPIILGFSPHIIPPSADWDDAVHVTGYWLLDEPNGWSPPEDLAAFLDDGEPPVFVGFGSMAGHDSESNIQIAIDALAQSGERGLLLTGWSGFEDTALPGNLFQISSCPFNWLFPRMKAIVHHGGSGTAAYAFYAGKPQIVIPYFSDQPFWGRMVYQHGVGPKSLSSKELSSEILAEAIHQTVNNHEMQHNATKLGEQIRTENGVDKAVELLKGILNNKP